MNIDDVVVISLPHRIDRLRKFYRGIPTGWPFPWPRVVPGVEVDQAPPSWRVSAGAYGCAQAHVKVIRDAYKKGTGALLVLEDDAVFTENFPYRWKNFVGGVPDPWAMIMLGGQHAIQPTQRYGNMVRCVSTRRTHAYIIRDRAMPLVARTWANARTHIDHLLPELEAQMQVYAPWPWMVGQRAGVSDISGGVHPSDRFWVDSPGFSLGEPATLVPGPRAQFLGGGVDEFDVDVADVTA